MFEKSTILLNIFFYFLFMNSINTIYKVQNLKIITDD